MKRIICFFSAVVLMLSVLTVPAFAQESSDFRNGFSFGTGGSMSPNTQGGFVEIGFPLYKNDTFFIRNHVEFNGGGFGSTMGYFGVRERLFFGSDTEINEELVLRTYGIADVGFSVIAGGDSPNTKSDFFTGPYIIEPRGGGGFSFVTNDGNSFFVEMMGGAQIAISNSGDSLYDKYPGTGAVNVTINFGGRWYAK